VKKPSFQVRCNVLVVDRCILQDKFPLGNALDRVWGNFKLVRGTCLAVFSLGLLLGCETQTIGEEMVVPSPLQFSLS
jgi:hypothetical protein